MHLGSAMVPRPTARSLLAALCCVGLTAACVGDMNERAAPPIVSNMVAPVLLNGLPWVAGRYRSDGPEDGPVKEVRLLPCWMEITFQDGYSVSGNYSAFGVAGSRSEGILRLARTSSGYQMDLSTGRTGSMSSEEEDVWAFKFERRIGRDDILALILVNVNANGTYGERSYLGRTNDQRTDGDRWCLSGTPPGLAPGPDGRAILSLPTYAFANEQVMGIWGGPGSIVKELRIGPCYAEVLFWSGEWMKGNYVASLPRDTSRSGGGTFDLDVFERGGPGSASSGDVESPSAVMEDPTWGELWGIRLSRGFLTVVEDVDTVEALYWKGAYPEGQNERWCLPGSRQAQASCSPGGDTWANGAVCSDLEEADAEGADGDGSEDPIDSPEDGALADLCRDRGDDVCTCDDDAGTTYRACCDDCARPETSPDEPPADEAEDGLAAECEGLGGACTCQDAQGSYRDCCDDCPDECGAAGFCDDCYDPEWDEYYGDCCDRCLA